MTLRTASPTAALPQAPARPRLLDRVGRTPLLAPESLQRGLSPAVRLLLKAEWANPSGSVKDRPAAGILQWALDQGAPANGQVLLDATSGNMGIAYATLAAPLGLRVHLMIPANASAERLAILRALGAELTLTDPLEGTDGARRAAIEAAASDPRRFLYADQYAHPANPQAHYLTTGPELLAQTEGRITHFVAGLGTSGTLMGAGRFLREHLPAPRLVAVQPDGPLHGLEGLKHYPSTDVPAIYDPALPDVTVSVPTEEAYAMARRLAREEGLLVGVSAAAAVAAGLREAHALERGVVVALLPDSGMKYLSEPFWSAP
jgi:S-sulfo-L-cysteine synthase (O-acetyl-L-serine-dependent)